MTVVQIIQIKSFISFIFVIDFTVIHYTGLSQYLSAVCDLYFLLYQLSLMIGPKIRLLRKILIIYFIDKIYWTNIIYILILLINSVLYYRLRIIIHIILSLYMNSIFIITVSNKVQITVIRISQIYYVFAVLL